MVEGNEINCAASFRQYFFTIKTFRINRAVAFLFRTTLKNFLLLRLGGEVKPIELLVRKTVQLRMNNLVHLKFDFLHSFNIL